MQTSQKMPHCTAVWINLSESSVFLLFHIVTIASDACRWRRDLSHGSVEAQTTLLGDAGRSQWQQQVRDTTSSLEKCPIMICAHQIFPVVPPAITRATNWVMRGTRWRVCAGTQTSSLTSVLRGDSQHGKTQSSQYTLNSVSRNICRHWYLLLVPVSSTRKW